MVAGLGAVMAGLERPDELAAEAQPELRVRVLAKSVPVNRSGPLWSDHSARLERALGVSDLLALANELVAQAQASGEVEDLAAREPARLDREDRATFWALYRVLRPVQLAGLMPEQLRLVQSAIAEAWRLARWSGIGDREAALVTERQRGSGAANPNKRQRVLAEERALYRVWKQREAEIKRAEPLAKRRADALLKRLTVEILEVATKAELAELAGYPRQLGKWSWPSEERVTQMIRWWDRGHDPTKPGAHTWRELEDGKATL